MAKRVGVDKWLYGVTVLLVFMGLLMVFSASAVMAEDRYGSPYFFVSRQIGWAVLGLVTMTVLMRIDYRRFNRPIVVFPAVAVTTLLLLAQTLGVGVTLAALAVNLVLVVLAFAYSSQLGRLISPNGLRAISKIISLLLAAIAVNMIRRGIMG